VKRHIVEAGGAIALCLAAYLSYRIASSSPILSQLELGFGTDSASSDLAPEWINLPAWRLKWPKLRTFCTGLCTDEELMR